VELKVLKEKFGLFAKTLKILIEKMNMVKMDTLTVVIKKHVSRKLESINTLLKRLSLYTNLKNKSKKKKET